MELHYVEVKDWNNLGDNDIVLFKLPEKQIEYHVIVINKELILGVFCNNIESVNSEIFDCLNLDAPDFVQNIVGYPCTGGWPKVKSMDDLKKVIKALDNECVKKFGNPNTSKFKIGDKVRILPRIYKPEDYIGVYIDEMLQYTGKIAYIRLINPNSSIVLEGNSWTWDPKALELVNEKEEATNPLNYKKRETQFEAELNLFPTKKHYQLNFNY